ncbi:MAG: YggS family pyridoxal phosphate-dependent enzyme [Actinomycetota bacterium]|nr:YggS family pyridoxal phosphate-dependent enzyme [Actinomycetota bacterium]
MNEVTRVPENLASVRERIAAAAERSGRDPGAIVLVAVSKNVPDDLVMEAAEAGQRVFGENRAQELTGRLERLGAGLEWHFIGHLQRNKVNMVVGRVALIHSVDSERLLEAIHERARGIDVVQDVLLQVNVTGEASKFGLAEEEVAGLLEKARSLPNVRVRGLMTMAAFAEDPEEARPCFRRLRELRERLEGEGGGAGLEILSMGMTQDFEVAVEEGANMLRVGTAIFAR